MATKLLAPNGVEVLASDADTPILLAAGYTRAEKKRTQEKQVEPKKAAKKPAKKSTKKDE